MENPGQEHFAQVAADTEHERGKRWTIRTKLISRVLVCKTIFWSVYFFKESGIIQNVNTYTARCCTEKEHHRCSLGVAREFNPLAPVAGAGETEVIQLQEVSTVKYLAAAQPVSSPRQRSAVCSPRLTGLSGD